jgi:hypothetical protein
MLARRHTGASQIGLVRLLQFCCSFVRDQRLWFVIDELDALLIQEQSANATRNHGVLP